MLLSTFLGKISGPIIYGFLADKYEKKNYALAQQICISYFFIGVIIIFFLFYFKIREVDNEKSDIIILEENIITTLRTFSDENDLFNIEMARINKRSNAFYKSKVICNEHTKIMLKPILSSSHQEISLFSKFFFNYYIFDSSIIDITLF